MRNNSNLSGAGKSFSRRKTFTLIELLVVISIISILMAMLLPALKSARETAHAIVCTSNMKQQGTAVASYCFDSSMWFPAIHPDTDADYYLAPECGFGVANGNWYLFLQPYLNLPYTPYPDKGIFLCPTNRNMCAVAYGGGGTASYGYNYNGIILAAGANPYLRVQRLDNLKAPSASVVLCDTSDGFRKRSYYYPLVGFYEAIETGFLAHSRGANIFWGDLHVGSMKNTEIFARKSAIIDYIKWIHVP